MFKRVLIFIFLLSAFNGISQTITISEELPMRNDYAYTILGWVSGDLLLFRDRGHEFFIQAFDEEMHLKWEREILFGAERTDIIGVLAHSDKFHLVVGIRNKGDYILQHLVFDHTVTLIDSMTLDVLENNFISPRVLLSESE